VTVYTHLRLVIGERYVVSAPLLRSLFRLSVCPSVCLSVCDVRELRVNSELYITDSIYITWQDRHVARL